MCMCMSPRARWRWSQRIAATLVACVAELRVVVPHSPTGLTSWIYSITFIFHLLTAYLMKCKVSNVMQTGIPLATHLFKSSSRSFMCIKSAISVLSVLIPLMKVLDWAIFSDRLIWFLDHSNMQETSHTEILHTHPAPQGECIRHGHMTSCFISLFLMQRYGLVA